MTYDALGPGPLDYLPCRYGTSKLMFRGPRRNLEAPYIAFLGGTETYGKFIEKPFPALVEETLGRTCVNFGFPNAGIDVFAHDPFVAQAASEADVTVVQIMGAQNMTNRFYSVHPRRNDRFVGASPLLQTIYREVDFSEFHFTRHMLNHLLQLSPERFDAVRHELQQAWQARMRLMLGQIKGKTILLWLADHAPQPEGRKGATNLGADPLFVTEEMMKEVSQHATAVVQVVAPKGATREPAEGMIFGQMEALAASEMLGPRAHRDAAAAVSTVLHGLL
ncbi:hypothetical protein HTT03_14825 [Sulfitobacter sp. S0837]|uniref:DUF6473 family protein n=1 Tax=Sulfitobacter maritimus TaxID=2741719 RepID=UPI001581EAF0|nr:DUF6473 family protein [Sulfitobacter maritimus]NUH66555.1 hypothetical protein [Sulfitobacter maritimus]